MLLNDRTCSQQELDIKMGQLMKDSEKRLRDIVSYQEDRLKEHLFNKVDNDDLKDMLKTKASKVDYGDLYKKYS